MAAVLPAHESSGEEEHEEKYTYKQSDEGHGVTREK